MYNSEGGGQSGGLGPSISGGYDLASGQLTRGSGGNVGVDRSMGIRFYCPNGHKLNVKEFQAGRKGICPYCGSKIEIPTQSTRPPSKRSRRRAKRQQDAVAESSVAPAEAGQPAVVGAIEASTAGLAAPGPDGNSPVRGPAVEASPRPSPVAIPQNPAPTAAGFFPVAGAPPVPAEFVAEASPAAEDPLAEAGDVVWYVRPASGGQFGPAGSEVMRSWLRQGRVGSDSLVWREGWPDWRQAAGVFPQLGTGQKIAPLEEVTAAEVSGTGATAARSRRARSRRQSKKTQALTIILLVFTVIVLFAVLLWVVFA